MPQPASGEIWRIDPASGEKSLYASGLPRRFAALPFGGVMDVAFYGSTAYALVSVVGSSFPADLFACNPDLIGIYRIDGPSSSTLVADIGSFACDNPPTGFPFVVPTGVQYALEPFRGGFLVTDGHHNRVYRVTRDGTVTELIAVRRRGPISRRPGLCRTSQEPGRSCRSNRDLRRRRPSLPGLGSPWTSSWAAGRHSLPSRRVSSRVEAIRDAPAPLQPTTREPSCGRTRVGP